MPYRPLIARDHRRLRSLRPEMWTLVLEVWEIFGIHAMDAPDVFPLLGTCLRSPRRQERLWARGRAGAGRIVTNARAWQSAHVVGLAFHVVLLDGPRGRWLPSDHRSWQILGTVGEEVGLRWGGRWPRLRDMAHFEHPDWRIRADEDIQRLRRRYGGS